MFSKILVPVDGSDNSHRALDAALLLSEKLGAKVTAIHVMEDIPVLHIQSEKLLREGTRRLQKRKSTLTIKMFRNSYKKGIINKYETASGKCGLNNIGFLRKRKV